ncbi:Adipocyte plasma membrane-associated protein [Nymphon striatum]|nr:Adipocyte plasma membrane-associated protein [Nymphon striatum]
MLERFQATQASLQAKQQHLNIASALCASLGGSLQTFREQFDKFESEAQKLTQVQDYRPTRTRRIVRNRRRDEDVGSGRSVPDAMDNQSPKDRFRMKVFLAVLDSLQSVLEQRLKAYTQLNKRFSFLQNLHVLTPAQIQESADRLLEAYPQDLEDGLRDELPQFSEFVKHIAVDCSSPELNYFSLIKENNIDTTPIKTQPLKGDLFANDKLKSLERRFLEQIEGPESLAAFKGKIYTGLTDGRIIAIKGNTYENISVPKTECAGPWEQELCGRALGMRFASDGTLYVADCYRGLLKVNIKTGLKRDVTLWHSINLIDAFSGAFEVLIKAGSVIDGAPLLYLDDLFIDEERKVIYMSDASTKWTLKHTLHLFLETNPSGRILKYDLKTKEVSTILGGLYFANGVQLSHDKKSLLISDTTTTCVKRYHLQGPKKGQVDNFVCGLPGFPDNIRPSKRNGYWVALSASRGTKSTVFADWTIQIPPLIRKVILKIMDKISVSIDFISQNLFESKSWKKVAHMCSSHMFLFLKSCEKTGIVVELDEHGKIINTLHAPNGEIQFISEVLEHDDGKIYLGSYVHNFLGVISKK